MQIMSLYKDQDRVAASEDCIKEAKIVIEECRNNPEKMAVFKARIGISDEQDEAVIAHEIANNRLIKINDKFKDAQER